MPRDERDALSRLSPFELRNRLVQIATSHGERILLNAGRGNPNFLATAPRHGFFELGRFALEEGERSGARLPDGVAGLPVSEGIAARLESFATAQQGQPDSLSLSSAVIFACARFGFNADAFVHELVTSVLGCTYPEPPRMLRHAEAIVSAYLRNEMGGPSESISIDLCATEGATAGIAYVFNSLRENKLLAPGDTIAIGTPIFSPYLEIPLLNDYRLCELAVNAVAEVGWQYPSDELDKLRDPCVKALLLVHPGNPTSVKIAETGLRQITEIVAAERPDLIILTDDVYATFADNFTSLFALCPRNTILLYSFSKYFGATGWRLGVIATAADNMLDARIRTFPLATQRELGDRYGSLAVDPHGLKFIDRIVADSRAVALNHTAGLSTPQQAHMALFALFALMDQYGAYKQSVKQLIRTRYRALYAALGIDQADDPNEVCYYALLDLERIGGARYGRGFADWLLSEKDPLDILCRLADEAGVVLLPGKGFGMQHPSARVSLANLDEADYARIGHIIRGMIEDYAAEYQALLRSGRG
jgi:aspartate 4-decarboxylase